MTQPLSYKHAGPDLACEVLSLRDCDLDLHKSETAGNSAINQDIDRTARRSPIDNGFWQLAMTDIPWQLGEGTRTSLLDTDLGTNGVSSNIEEQTLSRHPRYAHSVLVRALFQCYHRADGKE